MNWCKDQELLQIVPTLPKIECPEPSTPWLNQEDQQKILNAIREPDRPIVLFSMLHGTRPGETRALKIKDVDLDQQAIRVSATFSGPIYRPKRKGRKAKPVVIPIHPECLPYIKIRVKSSTPEAWLFPNPLTGTEYSVKRWIKTWNIAKKALGIKGLTAYQMTRHSYASQLGAAGVPIQTIKNLLGHTEITHSKVYPPGFRIHEDRNRKAYLQKQGG